MRAQRRPRRGRRGPKSLRKADRRRQRDAAPPFPSGTAPRPLPSSPGGRSPPPRTPAEPVPSLPAALPAPPRVPARRSRLAAPSPAAPCLYLRGAERSGASHRRRSLSGRPEAAPGGSRLPPGTGGVSAAPPSL